MVDYAFVLSVIRPGAAWVLSDNDYATLDWQSPDPKPTQAELDAAWPRVQAERHNNRAKADRHAAFTAEADPLFMKWQAGEGEQSVWLAKREEIRNLYPYVEVPE